MKKLWRLADLKFPKVIKFRENNQKTWKTWKFLLAKVSAFNNFIFIINRNMIIRIKVFVLEEGFDYIPELFVGCHILIGNRSEILPFSFSS